MPAEIRQRSFERARDLVDYLIHDIGHDALYRGQENADWPLVPSAWRTGRMANLRRVMEILWRDRWVDLLSFTNLTTPESLAERFICSEDAESISRLRDLVFWLAAEQTVVNKFCVNCDRVALDVPGAASPSWTYSISERATFVGSGLSPRQLFREVPLYELTSAHALAQHMGVPTRLLDFSDHPLKAAFFALGPEGDGEFFAVESEYLCVWAAKPPISDDGSDVLSRLRGEIHRQVSVLRVLRSQIVNLHAQDGLFLSCNESANLHFLRHGEWPSLDQLMDGWQLEKLTLPSGEGPVLRRVLERLAIDSTTMMPSYKQAADDALRLLG